MVKILYVEDNEDNLYMLVQPSDAAGLRGRLGARRRAGDRDGGLSEAPALILMDLSLPVIDGWEATRRLKAEASTRNIPVIALSAHAMAGDREKAIAAGCDEYDTKPVDLPRLLDKITTLLGRRSP